MYLSAILAVEHFAPPPTILPAGVLMLNSLSYSPEDELLTDMAELLRALAHPLRISIIDLLKDSKQLTVSQIQRALGTEQAVASHHLIILKNKGVLHSRRYGKTTLYSLKDDNISMLVSFARKSLRPGPDPAAQDSAPEAQAARGNAATL